MKARVVKTENGWEPEFLVNGVWTIEPGFALPTRKAAQAMLDADCQRARVIDANERCYRSGLDYACGYHD